MATPTIATGPPAGYLTSAEARRLLGGIAVSSLQIVALRGEVKSLALPGRAVVYERASVERLAESRRQPERAGG